MFVFFLMGRPPPRSTRPATFFPSPTLFRSFTRATLLGAGSGGAYGVGSAEGGAANRAAGAGTGTALGAVTGLAAYPVVKGAEKAIQAIGRGIQNRMGPASAGQRKILQAIERDQMTPGKEIGRAHV